jgi:hypothetical protein
MMGTVFQIKISSARKRSAHHPLSFSITAGNMDIGDFTKHLHAILRDLQVSRMEKIWKKIKTSPL